MSMILQLFSALTFASAAPSLQGMPVVPEISTSLPDSIRQTLLAIRAPLIDQKVALRKQGADLNANCKDLIKGSAKYADCEGRKKDFTDAVGALRLEFERLGRTIDIAVASEVSSLTVRDQSLTAWIARDVLAIQRLGFDRRAEDFEAWETLADDARKDFERDMCDAVANMPTGLQCPQLAAALPTLWVASVRNNVTRRQALREVKLLNAKTDKDLKGLAAINNVMVKHVKERRELRLKLKALQEGA